MIDHEAEFAAEFEDAIDLLEDAAGMRGMVDHAPGPYETELPIGEGHLFGIHATHIGRQAAQLQPPPGIFDGAIGEIDADQIATGFGKKLGMGAEPATDLEDVLPAKLVEGDPTFEGAGEGATRGSGATIEGRRRKMAAIDLLVELPGGFRPGEGFVPILAHVNGGP